MNDEMPNQINALTQVEVVASSIILNSRDEVFLGISPKWGDVYIIPGGHIEPGESIYDAAVREGEEETGLRTKPLYCANLGELINPPEFHRPVHLIYFHVVCRAETDTPMLDEREIKEFIWAKPDELMSLNIYKGIRRSMENFLNGIKIPL